MASWTLRFIFNRPLKQWPTGRKKGRTEIQKFEYLESEKSFLDEIKSIFHSFWKTIIWWKNKNLMRIADTSFNILGAHWKIWLLEGGSQKTNIELGLPKKGGLDSLSI